MRGFLSNQMKSMVTTAACLVLCCGNSDGQNNDSRGSSPAPDQSEMADPGDLDDRLLEGIGQNASKRETASPAKPDPERPAGQDGVADEVGRLDEGSDMVQRNVLVQIGRQMLGVKKLLSERNVSSETQRNQREIVSQLDQVIAALSASQQAEQERKTEAGSKEDQEGGKVARIGKKAARKSSGKPEQSDASPREPAALQEMVGEIWGHLPERLRGQIQSVEAVEFLPRYRELIEDYYRRLAEER
ncbi:MAG: hypothetical protein ACQESR_14230 [Planctomycetota bacterium]